MTDPHRVRSTRPPQPRQVVQKTLKYSEGQEHLLRRLAGAIVLQWDELPDELQDLIIDQAAVVDDRDDAPHDAAELERFVRSVKAISLNNAAASRA